MPIQRQILCVGADRCVRPHGNAPLLWMMDAGQMSNSPCRGGLPRPPAVTTCLSCFQCAREVGASRSCRSRRYTLASFLSVATLSSPGPRAQHPTSHRVGRLLTDDLAFDGNKFRVGADRCVRPWCRQFELWLFDAVATRSHGGCLALVPKSTVHTFFTFVGCYTFVSRPSHSTSHLASRWQAGY